eukprot:11321725-Karenia_brevis.AAC.1
MRDATEPDSINHDDNTPLQDDAHKKPDHNDHLAADGDDSDVELQFFRDMNGDPFDDAPLSDHQYEVD